MSSNIINSIFVSINYVFQYLYENCGQIALLVGIMLISKDRGMYIIIIIIIMVLLFVPKKQPTFCLV